MESTTRHSRKREAILQAIRSTKCHPTADWIYLQLKPAHPDLSLATVYRNLGLFREQGLVKSVAVVGGQERYDGDVTPHSHFVCDACGAVIDLPDVLNDPELDRRVQQSCGLAVRAHEALFRGLCPACQGENPS